MTTVQEIAKSGCPKCGEKGSLRVGAKLALIRDVFWDEERGRLQWGKVEALEDCAVFYVFCDACGTETPADGLSEEEKHDR